MRLVYFYIYFCLIFLYASNAETSLSLTPRAKYSLWQQALNHNNDFFELSRSIEILNSWPRLKEIQIKAENGLDIQKFRYDPNDTSSNNQIEQLISFFRIHPPVTGRGQFIFARSLWFLNLHDEAKIQFIKLVNEFHIPDDIVKYIPEFQKILPFNWAFSQVKFLVLSEKFKDIKPYESFLTVQQKQVLDVYLKLLKQKGKAYLEAYEALKQSGDNGIIVLQLVQLHLSKNKKIHDDQAFSLLQHYQFSEESTYPDLFFKWRYKLARKFIDSKDYQKALDVLKQHQYTAKDCERKNDDAVTAFFLPAWLSIEFCDNPLWGLNELKKIENHIYSVKNKAKILFWIAKAYTKLGYDDLAVQYFLKASQIRSSFYGNIAYSLLKRKEFNAVLIDQKIDSQHMLDDHFETQNINSNDQEEFNKKDFVVLLKLMKEKTIPPKFDEFFDTLISLNSDPKFHQMVLKLAQDIQGDYQIVRLSVKKGFNMRNAYPLLKSNVFKKSIDPLVQKFPQYSFIYALAHSVIRQESYFNPEARSIRNAKGLMQLLNGTAKSERKNLKKLGIKMTSFNLFKSQDNVLLGVSYLIHLLNKYKGNTVLTLAAYNAGEGSVEKWINLFGDPNNTNINILNWIESIPFKETREYVQKVLENILIYEQILVEKGIRKKIDLDLVHIMRPKM